MIKFFDKPHKWTDGKWYGTFEFRSPCSTHECNFVYNPSTKRFEEIDEIAFGEWWDWDLNNLEDRQKEHLKEMYQLIDEFFQDLKKLDEIKEKMFYIDMIDTWSTEDKKAYNELSKEKKTLEEKLNQI